MLRNLLAMIIATIAGLGLARFIEGVIGGGAAAGEVLATGDMVGLVVGYFAGAFAAAMLAMLIGRRWAPLGWLGAATVLFAAIITLTTFHLPLLLWPASAAACAAGGWLAVRLRKAPYAYPHKNSSESLFD